MADDDVDHELLALLRQKFGLGGADPNAPPDTKVLRDAQFIYDNSIDVALSMSHTKLAAIAVLEEMQKREYSTKTWAEHELHPKSKDEATVNFIFTMDLLNFSFWSEKSEEERFAVEYKGKKWTGYWSLVACLQRALDEGIPITSPEFWIDEGEDEEDVPRDDDKVSSGDAPSRWQDPQAPRLPNSAFDTGVYPDSALVQQPTTTTPSDGTLPPETDAEAPRLPNEAFDTGVYPDTVPEQPTPEGPSNTASIEDQIPSDTSSETSAEDVFHDAASTADDTPETQSSETHPGRHPPTILERPRCTKALFRHVFRSCTSEPIPMFAERVQCLREAGRVLDQHFDSSVLTLVQDANGSAARLVNLLAARFPCFNDEAVFERKKVRLLKRAQIFVADLWAAFNGEGYGKFEDIDRITMFADYRVPQILNSLGLVSYCPPLEAKIRRGEMIESGHPWEVQIRGCSIWAVELLRREILKVQPDAKVNAILLDFFLYDLAKEKELAREEVMPHHRTRSIWY